MADELIQKRPYFSSVKKAREALKERANEILEAYINLAADAAAAGNREVAAEILWKLIDHTPADDEGNRIIDSPSSKPAQVDSKSTGPHIQIGIALGGVQKALPEAEVIDVSPIHDPNKTPAS